MLLGCITLGAALALCVGIQALFGWGRAQLDTGAALSADTLRLHIRAASDTIADQTDKLAVRDALLAYLDAHCTASTQPEARAWAAAHLPDLQLAAVGALARRGSFAPLRVQQKLNSLGEKLTTDGKYGASTVAAVQRYQRRNGLTADGCVGKATWEKMF